MSAALVCAKSFFCSTSWSDTERRSCCYCACGVSVMWGCEYASWTGREAGGGRGHARFYPIVIPGRATWREPGIHTPDRGYGFRVRADPVIGPRVARTRWHAPE